MLVIVCATILAGVTPDFYLPPAPLIFTIEPTSADVEVSGARLSFQPRPGSAKSSVRLSVVEAAGGRELQTFRFMYSPDSAAMVPGYSKQTVRWRKGKAYLLVIDALAGVMVGVPVLRILKPNGVGKDLALAQRVPEPAVIAFPSLSTAVPADTQRSDVRVPQEEQYQPQPQRWKIGGPQAIDPRRRVTFDIEPVVMDVEVIEAKLLFARQEQDKKHSLFGTVIDTASGRVIQTFRFTFTSDATSFDSVRGIADRPVKWTAGSKYQLVLVAPESGFVLEKLSISLSYFNADDYLVGLALVSVGDAFPVPVTPPPQAPRLGLPEAWALGVAAVWVVGLCCLVLLRPRGVPAGTWFSSVLAAGALSFVASSFLGWVGFMGGLFIGKGPYVGSAFEVSALGTWVGAVAGPALLALRGPERRARLRRHALRLLGWSAMCWVLLALLAVGAGAAYVKLGQVPGMLTFGVAISSVGFILTSAWFRVSVPTPR